jgi:hypothetical protein
MPRPAPIPIPSRRTDSHGHTASGSVSSSSSSLSSSGLYIPVHKRARGSISPASPSKVTPLPCRKQAPTAGERPQRRSTPAATDAGTPAQAPHTAHDRVYTISTLLALSRSPLSRISDKDLATIHENVPEILRDQRPRKAATQGGNAGPGVVSLAPRRRPIGRTQEHRRLSATVANWMPDVVDWRARRPIVEASVTVSVA